jgi:hypothetical protein
MINEEEKTVHAQVINAFKGSLSHQEHKEIGEILNRLREARVKADYNEIYLDPQSRRPCVNLLSQASYALLQSESVLSKLRKLQTASAVNSK